MVYIYIKQPAAAKALLFPTCCAEAVWYTGSGYRARESDGFSRAGQNDRAAEATCVNSFVWRVDWRSEVEYMSLAAVGLDVYKFRGL